MTMGTFVVRVSLAQCSTKLPCRRRPPDAGSRKVDGVLHPVASDTGPTALVDGRDRGVIVGPGCWINRGHSEGFSGETK